MDILRRALSEAGLEPERLDAWRSRGGEILYRAWVHGATAQDTWVVLRDTLRGAGWWPVLVGDQEELDRLVGELDRIEGEEGMGPAEILARADTVDPAAWFARERSRREEDREELRREVGLEAGPEGSEVDEEDWGSFGEGLPEEADPMDQDPDYEEDDEAGGWGDSEMEDLIAGLERAAEDEGREGGGRLAAPLDILSGKPLERVELLFVPARQPWEVPAWLGFGGFNECPEPAVHVALLRQWHEGFGAELATLSGSVLECIVAHPPASSEDALDLAREQDLYCGDIVDQGTGTVPNLARTLEGSGVWFFWWD